MWRQIIATIVVFSLVVLSWMVFHASDLGSVWKYLSNILEFSRWNSTPYWPAVVIILLAFCLDFIQHWCKDELVFLRGPALAQSGMLAAAILMILLAGSGTIQPFVYQGY